jgi:hypothetical protein
LRRARGKTYEAGAKLDWHSHPGGQVLLITEGAGYYQERRKPAPTPRRHSDRKILTHQFTHSERFLQFLSATWQPQENVSR